MQRRPKLASTGYYGSLVAAKAFEAISTIFKRFNKNGILAENAVDL